MTNKQVTLDECLLDRLKERLTKASLSANKTGRPVVLYRQTVEENDGAEEEEIATVNEKYIIVQVFTHGGYLPPNFQEQYVFTLGEFPQWLMKRSNELLLRTIENLDEELALK